MPLEVNLRHLEKKNLELEGDLSAEELDASDFNEMAKLTQPVHYNLVVEKLKESLLVSGSLEWTLDCQCVRCLAPFQETGKLDPWNANVPLTGEEAAPVVNDLVDLTPVIREDILLAFPQHPLCKTECSGLPLPQEGPAQRRSSPAGSSSVSPAWSELDKLKF